MSTKAMKMLLVWLSLTALPCLASDRATSTLDDHVARGMKQTKAQGLAIAIVEAGQVTRVSTWGQRNVNGDPLTPATVMYAASLTKAVFA